RIAADGRAEQPPRAAVPVCHPQLAAIAAAVVGDVHDPRRVRRPDRLRDLERMRDGSAGRDERPPADVCERSESRPRGPPAARDATRRVRRPKSTKITMQRLQRLSSRTYARRRPSGDQEGSTNSKYGWRDDTITCVVPVCRSRVAIRAPVDKVSVPTSVATASGSTSEELLRELDEGFLVLRDVVQADVREPRLVVFVDLRAPFLGVVPERELALEVLLAHVLGRRLEVARQSEL